MRRLRKVIPQKRKELGKNKSLILHHDKILDHASMHVGESLNKNDHASITVFTGLGPPSDFLLFPKLKTPVKGQYFSTIEEIKEKSKEKLLTIPKSAFQKCFEDCRKTLV